MVNLLVGLDSKESVSRGQNTTLYNRIIIYNLCGIEKLQSKDSKQHSYITRALNEELLETFYNELEINQD